VVIAFGKSSEHRAERSVRECRFEMTPVCKVIYVLIYIYIYIYIYVESAERSPSICYG